MVLSNSLLCCLEALPVMMPSNSAPGTGDTAINEVSEYNYRQCRSYHRAPSFRLSSYIDPHVTSQVRVFVFTLEVSFTVINVSIVIVSPVIFSSVFGHDITSMFFCFVVGLVPCCLIKRYGIKQIKQCEPIGRWMVGKSYQNMGVGL